MSKVREISSQLICQYLKLTVKTPDRNEIVDHNFAMCEICHIEKHGQSTVRHLKSKAKLKKDQQFRGQSNQIVLADESQVY